MSLEQKENSLVASPTKLIIVTSDLNRSRVHHRIANSSYFESSLNAQMHISESTPIWYCDIARELSRYGDAVAVTSSFLTAQELAVKMEDLMMHFGSDLEVVIGSVKTLPDCVLEAVRNSRRYVRVNLSELPTSLLRSNG